MANKYGGIPVAEESANRFGGIPVDAEPEEKPESRGDHVFQESKSGMSETLGMPMDMSRMVIEGRASDQDEFARMNFIGELIKKGASRENAEIIANKKFSPQEANSEPFGISGDAGGADWFRELMGYEKVDPRSGTEEAAGGVAKFVAGGAPINIPLALTKGALKAGGRSLAGNTGIDASAGMFGELGQSITGNQYGELGGNVVGGVVAPAALSQRAALLSAIKQGFKSGQDPATMRPIAQAMVGKELSQVIPRDDNFVGALTEAEESLRKARAFDRANLEADSASLAEVRGLNPTLASQTGSEAVMALEGQAARRSAADLSERQLKDEANRITLKEHYTLQIPKATQGGESAVRGERLKMNRQQKSIDDEIQVLEQERIDLSQIDSVDQSSVGDVIKAERKAEKIKLDAEKDEKYAAVSQLADNLKAKVNVSETLSLIDDSLKSTRFKLDPANMPAVLSNTERVIGKGGEVTFNDATKILEEVTADIGDELVTGNRKRLRELYKIKKSVEGELKKFGESGNQELAKTYNDARDFYRDVYAPKLLKGSNVKLSRINSLGEDRVLSENVVKEYFKPNGITGARRFKELYGNNPAANDALESGILDLYKSKVMRGDEIKQPLHDSFMRIHGSVLEEYPSVKAILESKGGALKAINERDAALIVNRKAIEQNIIMRTYEGDKDFPALIDEALGSKKKAFELVYSLPAGKRDAVVVSMWERLYEKAAIKDTQGMDGDKLLSMIADSEEALKISFRGAWGSKAGKLHLENLKGIAKKSKLLERGVLKGTHTVDKGTGNLMAYLSRGLSSAAAVNTGRAGSAYVVGMMLGTVGLKTTQQQQHLVMKEMLYNPELAKTIADAYRPSSNKTAIAKRMLKQVKPILKAFAGTKYYPEYSGQLAPKAAAQYEDEK